MKKHNFMIDVLRFLASFAVVLFHLNIPKPVTANWYHTAATYGWLGVPVFFVVSGYCIALSAYHSRGKSQFLSRRFFRIFPAYWASLLIVVLVACFQKIYTGTNSVQGLPSDFRGFLAVLTLTTSPFSNIGTINWVYWSLTCELFFYLAVWLALFFGKDKMIWVLVLVSAVSCFLPVNGTGLLFIFGQWPAFGLGLAIFYYFNGYGTYPATGCALLFLLNLVDLYIHFAGHPDYILVSVVAAGIIFVSDIRPVPKNLMAALGQYSYSIYLIHVPIGVFFMGVFESAHLKDHPFANIAYDLGIYILVSFAAWGLYTTVEKPAIGFGRKLFKRNTPMNIQEV